MGENLPKHKSFDSLYLDRLQFDPGLRKSWLNFFVSNFRVVVLLIILLTGLGVYSYTQLPLESNPEVKIPIAVVITTYPGASPIDVEELITKPIETKLSGLQDIDTITSNSSNSLSIITVEYDARANLDDSLRKLRDQVNNIKNTLPADANDPAVQEISIDDSPIFIASLVGPYDGFTLRKYAEDIQDELEKIPGVREARISGGDTREFEVAYDPQKLTFYSLSPDQVNQTIKGTNLVFPAGAFDGKKFVYPIKADARFFDVKILGNTPITHTADGALILLKDIATVSDRAVERTVYSRFSSNAQKPQDDITISIIKKTGGSIVDTAEQVKAKMDLMLKTMPPGLSYDVTIDSAELIKEDFDQLSHDFLLTIILVFSILFIIVGLKEAFVAGLAVPLVFFATFGVMLQTGITLNFLSMFSLILALGLLVDDAIVVVSATKQYLKTGKFTPEEAVLLVLNDFKVVLTTTTLTTVWAFLPLLSASGIIGQFIKSIPITVSVTLISSLLIALMINHPLAAVLERIRLTKKIFFFIITGVTAAMLFGLVAGNLIIKLLFLVIGVFVLWRLLNWYHKTGRAILAANAELSEREWRDDELIKKKLLYQSSHENGSFLNRLIHGIVHLDVVLPLYDKYLNKIIATKKTRLMTLGAVALIFLAAILLPVTGIVSSEFFPPADFDYMYINIEAPSGLRLDETNIITSEVEKHLFKYPEIANFSTIVGVPAAGNSFSGAVGNPTNSAAITIKLKKGQDRKIKSYDLADEIRRDLDTITGATITVESPRGGPPAGADFEARIAGDDLQVLDKVARDLKPILTSIKGVVSADVSLKDSPADYTFTLDPARMELYNLNAAYVGSTLRMAISGTEVTKVIIGGKEVKVMARFAQDKIPTLESIQNLQILNLQRQPVFLKDLATIELKPSVERITRINQKRTVLLSASVNNDNRPTEVVKEFQNKLSKGYQLPAGYIITYGGANEQNNESVLSIIRAMFIAALLIVSTLIIQFNSFKKALIVLVTIPLALIGVFFGLAVAQISLSFPGLIGILALFGIVVKNAIILIDKINLNLRNGIEFKSAVVDAGKSRLEAIFITSICTIFGIIPITFSNETWTALGGAVIFGLMLSSFLTLFIIPTLFMTLIKENERF